MKYELTDRETGYMWGRNKEGNKIKIKTRRKEKKEQIKTADRRKKDRKEEERKKVRMILRGK